MAKAKLELKNVEVITTKKEKVITLELTPKEAMILMCLCGNTVWGKMDESITNSLSSCDEEFIRRIRPIWGLTIKQSIHFTAKAEKLIDNALEGYNDA
jgi:hypothetical protein